MKMGSIKYLFLLMFTAFNIGVSGQDRSMNSDEDLNAAGIKIKNFSRSLNQSEIAKLSKFNFDEYRKYNQTSLVQIANGPVIELSSLLDITSQGKKVDQTLIDSKRNTDYSTVTHESMPLIHLGFGNIVPTYPAEIEYYMNSKQ